MARSVREMITALVEDPGQARLNRMRRLLPLPMLALSAAITFAVPVSAFHRWARFELGLPLTARKLLVSETTIKTPLLHIYTKLGVRDRASAVATAYKRGLIG